MVSLCGSTKEHDDIHPCCKDSIHHAKDGDDSREHPECRYSSSTSKECSSNNGKYACETILRIFKSCPNVRTEKIYEKTTTDKGTRDASSATGGSGGDQKHPGADSLTRRPPGFPFIPPEFGALGGLPDGADELLGKIEKHLKSFFEETSPTWKANMGITPDVPAPHKAQTKNNASDVEQA